jgi:predicted GIY-YIG superfamily endonuclease
MEAARRREIQIKKWKRKKKEALIRSKLEDLKSLSKRRVS